MMPALPPALDTPQHHALLWQRHPARQEAARVLFCHPLGRLPRHKGGAVVAIARAVRQRRGLRALGRFGAGRVAGAGAVRRRGEWQDLRTMHDSRGPCSEKGPFLARYSRGVSSDGGLRGFSDTWRAHLAKASSFWMHGARILPRSPPFLVRGHFRDAWSAKLATDCRPGTHRGGILPRQSARERIAREPCHRRTPGERISRAFCHRRAPGNASGHNLAIARCPETNQ